MPDKSKGKFSKRSMAAVYHGRAKGSYALARHTLVKKGKALKGKSGLKPSQAKGLTKTFRKRLSEMKEYGRIRDELKSAKTKSRPRRKR